jgi:hypothetical protein
MGAREGACTGSATLATPQPGLRFTDPVCVCACVCMCVCVFITEVPNVKLFARGEGDSGGLVLRETTN